MLILTLFLKGIFKYGEMTFPRSFDQLITMTYDFMGNFCPCLKVDFESNNTNIFRKQGLKLSIRT